MENQNNQNNESGSNSFLQWGFLGLLAYGVVRYLNYLENDSVIENPEAEIDDKSESLKESEAKKEPETINKYSEEIDEEVVMKVRKSAEHEKGTWIAILCRADGQESDKCFYSDTKEQAIEDAFQDALSCYREMPEE